MHSVARSLDPFMGGREPGRLFLEPWPVGVLRAPRGLKQFAQWLFLLLCPSGPIDVSVWPFKETSGEEYEPCHCLSFAASTAKNVSKASFLPVRKRPKCCVLTVKAMTRSACCPVFPPKPHGEKVQPADPPPRILAEDEKAPAGCRLFEKKKTPKNLGEKSAPKHGNRRSE